MVAPISPASVQTYGKRNFIFVPTLATPGPPAVPLATEVTGASSLDLSNMLFDGQPMPTQTTNRVTMTRRLGQTYVPESIGTTNYTGGTLTYSYDPQSIAGSNGKKAWEKFLGGVTGFIIDRLGLTVATAPVTGQFVNVWPVQLGPSIIIEEASGENAEAAAQCEIAVTGLPTFAVALG